MFCCFTGIPGSTAELGDQRNAFERIPKAAEPFEVVSNEIEPGRKLREDSRQLSGFLQRPQRCRKPFGQFLIAGMFLQEPGRDAKDELKSPSSPVRNLLNRRYFRNPEVRETNLAAPEIPAVVLQPRVWGQISRVENRNPVAILEAACAYQDHGIKIGEDLVKIKAKQNWEGVPSFNFRAFDFGYQV
jgi:hypothetical protein